MTTLQITRSSDVLPAEEVAALQPVLDDIERLKVERNAIVAAPRSASSSAGTSLTELDPSSNAAASLSVKAEVAANPRSRSAVLRVAERLP